MRIYLTGFMGSGKSTVGRALATSLGLPFFDLDTEMEQSTGKSVQAIFEEQGERSFRQLETDALRSISSTSAVIATGGGCFLFNRDWMLKNGTVVHLEVPFSILAERIAADPSRPLWKNAERLFHERSDHYRKAHIIVDASSAPERVVADIKKQLLKAQKIPGN